VTNQLLKRRSV